MTAAMVVLGWGNPSRGDDALGPLFCAELEDWLADAGRSSDCEVLQDFQLQVEHALDLVGRDLVLFVDAKIADGDATPRPFVFSRLVEARDHSHTTHALSAQAVLAVYRQIHGKEAPPAFLLGLHGESFELGDDLSPRARENLRAAGAFARELLERPEALYWDQRAAGALSDRPEPGSSYA